MKLNLKQLETFVWVADLGSFRKAAKRLNTTQPNISARIASLEATLGTALMERDAGSVRLTTRGADLLNLAREVMQSVDRFIDAADDPQLVEGVLRLGVTEMVVHTWLRDFSRELKEQYPNVLLELNVDLSVNLERELAERSIDLALQSGPFSHRMSGSQALGTYPVIWVASADLALPKKLSIERLAEHPILTHARNTQPYQEVAEHFAARPDLRARLVPSSNLSACLQMTIDGFGIAALLAPMVKDYIESGELVQLRYAWSPSPLEFYARYDQHKANLQVINAANLAAKVAKSYKTNKFYSTKS